MAKSKKRGRPKKTKAQRASEAKTEAKKQDLERRKIGNEAQQKKLQDKLGNHLSESKDHFQTLRDGYDEKEAMLVCALEDEISGEDEVRSSVFDPRLSTIVFERASRVMAQNPTGKAYPVSSNDLGKAKFMNLLLGYHTTNANYWHSMLIKLRIMDIYSMVYGTMFGLVPWIVNTKSGHVGPEFIPLPIRSCYPQPSATSINESDWFQVSSMKSLDWIKKQKDKKGWINIDKLVKKISQGKDEDEDVEGDTKEEYQQSFVEKEWYPEQTGDKTFPKIWLQTEYQRGRWYVFAPNYDNLLVRDTENPFDNNELPIVAKHAFPLMDSIIGLGEFERGQTLQLAINSLINLYLDGVRYSIFPPVHIDPDSVIDSSIKWGPGEKWLMKRPGIDAQVMKLSPQGMQTFQSTYGFMVSALLNQAGTTAITQPTQVEGMMGKTPQALRLQAAKESARDEWDRVMMEDTIKQIYGKWLQMIVKKQSKKVAIRIFGKEAQQLAESYPDVVEFFKDMNYGVAKVGRKNLASKYDYELESGATLKNDTEGEKSSLVEILGMIVKAPGILQSMRMKGKDLDIGELFKRIVISSGIKDHEKIIIDIKPEEAQAAGAGAGPEGPGASPGGAEGTAPTERLPVVPTPTDPDIKRTFQAVQSMAGRGAVPPMPRQSTPR